MADLGTAYVRVAPNMTGIQGKIAAGFKGSAGPATAALGDEVNRNAGPFQSALGKLGGLAKTAGIAIATGMAAGAAGIALLAKNAIMAGAELEQQLGGSEAVFGEFAKNIQATANDAYTNMGLSQNEFLQGANKMGSLFQGAGFDVQSSMKMSEESMQRASDVASIMGIDTTAALEAVTGMAKGNFTMMDNLGVAMNDTSIQAYALSKGINKTTAEMTAQEKVGLAQQMFMEKTAKYAGNYAKENDTLAGSINTTKKAFQDFMATGNVTGFINSLVSTIKIAIPKIVDLLPTLVDGIAQILTSVLPAIQAALPTLIPALINAVQMLLNALITALPTILQTLINALPMFINAFIQLFLALVKALPQIVTILANSMPMIVDALVKGLTSPEALTAMILGSIQLFLAILQALPVIISALIAAVPTIVKNIIATLTSPVFIKGMVQAGVDLIKATISGIKSMIGSVASAAWEIIKTIGSTLSPSNLLNVGKDVVKGLWSGIESMGGWLKDKVVAWVKEKIPGPIKRALGINSPSRVAAELGKQVPRGLAVGINATSDLVTQAANNMADKALVGMGAPLLSPALAFGGSSSGIGGANGGNTTYQEVDIQQVNLHSESAVKEWFKQLNRDTINLSNGITPIQGAQP